MLRKPSTQKGATWDEWSVKTFHYIWISKQLILGIVHVYKHLIFN